MFHVWTPSVSDFSSLFNDHLVELPPKMLSFSGSVHPKNHRLKCFGRSAAWYTHHTLAIWRAIGLKLRKAIYIYTVYYIYIYDPPIQEYIRILIDTCWNYTMFLHLLFKWYIEIFVVCHCHTLTEQFFINTSTLQDEEVCEETDESSEEVRLLGWSKILGGDKTQMKSFIS